MTDLGFNCLSVSDVINLKNASMVGTMGLGEVDYEFGTQSLPIVHVEVGSYQQKDSDQRVTVVSVTDSTVTYQYNEFSQLHVCTPDEFIAGFEIVSL